jgi:protocatechuate 3,4-dioxygenase beta subunit
MGAGTASRSRSSATCFPAERKIGLPSFRSAGSARRTRVVLLAGLAFLAIPPSIAPQSAPGPTVRGTLIGLDGRPAAGARVELRPWAPSHARRLVDLGLAEAEVIAVALADAEGRFALAAPAIDSYELHVLPENAAPLRQRYQPLVEDADEGLVELRRAKTVSVEVRDEDGDPIAGAVVVIDTASPATRSGARAPPWVPRLSGRTDESGRFRFTGLDGAERAIHVVAPGHLRSSQRTGASEVAATLRAAPIRVLEVRDERGRPVAGAVVREGDDLVPRGVTGEDGRFEAPVAPEGTTYQVEAADLCYGQATVEAPDGAGGASPVIVTLEPPAIVEGRIVDASSGDPIGGAAVWAARRPEDLVHTSPDGVYRLATWSDDWGVAVAAAAPGFAAGNLRVAHDQLARRDTPALALVPALALAGVVVDPESAPVPGAEVALAAQPGPGRDLRTRVIATSAADGSFRLSGVPYGVPFDLRVEHPGYAIAWEELGPFDRDRPPEPLRIRLSRGLTAVGRVVDRDDRPLAGARVELWPLPAGSNPWRQAAFPREATAVAVTGEDGGFRLAAVPPGRYDLDARSAGFAPTEVPGLEVRGPGDAAESAPEVELGTVVLLPGARLEGRVVDRHGEAVAGVGIAAQPSVEGLPPRPPRPSEREPRATSDANGRFTLDDLPHDALIRLTAVHPSHRSAEPVFVRTPTEELVILQVDAGDEEARRLRGQVLGSDGAPLANATVTAVVRSASGQRSTRQTTGAQGRFEFPAQGAAPIELWASGPGHRLGRVLVEVPGSDEEVLIRLDPGATVHGRIVGPRGEAVIGARVSSVLRGDTTGFASTTAVSDGEGRYRLDGVAPGLHDFETIHPDYRPLRRELEVELGERVVDLELEEGLTVAGRVVGPRGEAVPRATIRALPAVQSPTGLGDLQASTTDDEGRFSLGGLAPGTYAIVAEHDELGRGLVELELGRDSGTGSLRDVEIRLEPGLTLEGRVTGVEFDALPQVRIIATRSVRFTEESRSTPWSSRAAMAAPDYEGRFELRGLEPGAWTVFARHPDGRTTQATVELGADLPPEPLVLRFEVEDAATLSGLVRRDGSPVPGARVEALAVQAGGERSTVTDHQGRFELRNLEPGEWNVSAQDGGASALARVRVDGEAEALLDLEETRLVLLVVDAATGEPLAGAQATAYGPAGIVRESMGQVTGADGRLELPVIPGGVNVNVQRAGYAPKQDDLELAAGERRELVVELEAGSTLVLEIVRPDGAPYDGLPRALLRSADGAHAATAEQRPSPGRLEIDAVPAGSWTLELHADGFAPLRVPVTTPSEGPVRVTLREGGRVRVSIPELASEQRAFVVALDPDPPPGAGTPIQALVQTGAPLVEGEALLGPLPEGTWKLLVQIFDERVLAAGGDPTRAPSTHEGLVRVVEGQTVDAVMTRSPR